MALSTAAAALSGVLELADAAGEHDGPSRVDPVVAVMVLAGLLLRRRSLQAIVFALGIGGSVALTIAVKLWVARPRPGSVDRLGPVDRSSSFPSGLIAIGWLGVVWLVRPQVERVVARAVPTRRGSAETAPVPDVWCRPPRRWFRHYGHRSGARPAVAAASASPWRIGGSRI